MRTIIGKITSNIVFRKTICKICYLARVFLHRRMAFDFGENRQKHTINGIMSNSKTIRMEFIEQNGEQHIELQNPKLQIIKSKNQIDFFMHDYAVYKKNGTAIIEVAMQQASGEESHQYYELTQDELDADDFRSIANSIRKDPAQYSNRKIE